MSKNPLSQFELKSLIDFSLGKLYLPYTNSSLVMSISVFMIMFFFIASTIRSKIIPGRLQMAAEYLVEIITEMIDSNLGSKNRKFIPLIFSIFLFVLLCNILGMLPYSFTATSHISVTYSLGLLLFIVIIITGFTYNGLKFFKLFLPSGTPLWLSPLMIIIEFFGFISKPVSLSLRLSANMMAGHILIKVIAGFIISSSVINPIPIPLIVILIGFEIFISILQAYIFAILACVYLNDAINMH